MVQGSKLWYDYIIMVRSGNAERESSRVPTLPASSSVNSYPCKMRNRIQNFRN